MRRIKFLCYAKIPLQIGQKRIHNDILYICIEFRFRYVNRNSRLDLVFSENRTTEISAGKEVLVIVSTLIVERASPRHAGNYSCVVPGKAKTTVAVHVLNGEYALYVDTSAILSLCSFSLSLVLREGGGKFCQCVDSYTYQSWAKFPSIVGRLRIVMRNMVWQFWKLSRVATGCRSLFISSPFLRFPPLAISTPRSEREPYTLHL